ncbi:MAG: pyridoxamine 5'-phosphate oxidase family protein [Gammaproteobacteria bacterium]|nr:pyridoxamine 5'-phosphate oxidase family protein [Gammaproteobacteria bacterium]
MDKDAALKQSMNLVAESNIAFIGSVDDHSYPNIKAMLKIEHDGLKKFYFSTNTSAKRVNQFLQNPKGCIYFVSFKEWKGLMLTGEMLVLQDAALKQKMWRAGFEKYYPKGVADPDYSVLQFTAFKANYYHQLCNVDFDIP